MKVEDVLEILSIPLLAIVPESGEVLRSSNVGAPVTLGSPGSAPAQAYLEAARRLKGERTETVIAPDRPRLLQRLFTRRAGVNLSNGPAGGRSEAVWRKHSHRIYSEAARIHKPNPKGYGLLVLTSLEQNLRSSSFRLIIST